MFKFNSVTLVLVIAILALVTFGIVKAEESSPPKATIYITVTGYMSNDIREALNASMMFDNYSIVTERRSATHEMKIRINRMRISSGSSSYHSPSIQTKIGGSRYSIPISLSTSSQTYTYTVSATIENTTTRKRVWPNEQQLGGLYSETGTDRNTSISASMAVRVYTQGYQSMKGLTKAIGQMMVESQTALTTP